MDGNNFDSRSPFEISVEPATILNNILISTISCTLTLLIVNEIVI